MWLSYSEALPFLACSFRAKGGMPKKGRWFSWHEQAASHLKEWRITRMLLTWSFPTAPDPNQNIAATLQSLRNDKVGGLHLALMCMTDRVLLLSHVMLSVAKPCWSHHAWRIRNVQTSEAHIELNVSQVLTRKDWHGFCPMSQG